jgi:hypothetical protein
MTLIGLLITLVIFGVALYLITLIPMDATVRKVIQVIAILFLILFVLQSFGFINSGIRLR